MGLKLLLTENQSALGQAIARALDDYPYTLLCPPAGTLDWADARAVQRYVEQHHPGLVINTLAVAEIESAASVSADLSENVAKACSKMAALHLSSYQVFGTAPSDGEGCDESDTPEPTDPLGRELLLAERAFLSADKGLVLRLPWLAHHRGDNIFTRVATRLAEGGTLEVSDVRRGGPTTVDEVARVVLAMVLQILCGAENWGAFHLHTSDSCSEAEYSDHIARLLEKEAATVGKVEIVRNPQDHLTTGCGLLTGTRCTNNFGVQLRSWRHGMKNVVKEWLRLKGKP